jgi:hypothetical protein
MEVVKIILQIAGFLGISSLFTLYITERIKNKIKNSFDIKLEEVKMINSKEISQFQSELNHLKSKENFKFTKLHEKRFEVLQKTFQYLNETLTHLQFYISPVRERNNESIPEMSDLTYYMNYSNAQDEFFNYFRINKLFLNEEIADLLTNYFIEADKIFGDFENELKTENVTKSHLEGKSIEARDNIGVIILPILEQIENKFRELLGE